MRPASPWSGALDMWRLRHCGLWPVKSRLDRLYLEYILLPRLRCDRALSRLLTIGVAPFTQHYYSFFEGHVEVYSLDIDPGMARYGATIGHVTGCCSLLPAHYSENNFDAVLMNGVYGWGLDDRMTLKATLDGIRHILRPGGLLVFGWDRNTRHDPLVLDAESFFAGFARSERIGTSRRRLPSRHKHHIFDVYQTCPA